MSRITSPEQLHQIELASPQIRGEDEELWRNFIARDFPKWKLKNYRPKNPVKWYEVYKRYRKEQEEEIERDKEILREAMAGIKKEKETHVSKAVDSKYLPKQPRDPRMLSNDGGVPISGRRKALAKPGSSSLSFAAGSKTKMKDPASVLTRARREAKEISSRNKLGKPTHVLRPTSPQVLRAPKAMIDDHRRAAASRVRIIPPRKKPDSVSNSYGSVSSASLEERERRLKAMKTSSTDTKVIYVGSDPEDDSEDDPDDLFGEKKTSPIPPPPNKPYSKQATQHMPDSNLARRPGNPRPLSKPKESPAKPSPEVKPSDVISSIISKPRPKQIQQGHDLPQPKSSPPRANSPAKLPSPPTPPRTVSPVKRSLPKPPMLPKRKPEVDIFNRTGGSSKRQRV